MHLHKALWKSPHLGTENQIDHTGPQYRVDGKRLFRFCHCNFKGVDLCEILFDIEEHPDAYSNCNVADSTIQSDLSTEDLESLREENYRLKESNLCKVCADNQADVIFLPCGHMVCCPQCATAIKKCSVCRKTINGPMQLWSDLFVQHIRRLDKYEHFHTTVDSNRRHGVGFIYMYFFFSERK